MASSSIPNFSEAFVEGDDLDTAVNRALYYEPINHAFRKYSSFGLTEEDIAQTVEKASGDGEYLTNLLIEHHEALSTFGIGNIQSLYHLLFLFYESFDFIQVSVNASESVEDQPIDIEILEAPKTPKHQLKVAAQQEEPIKNLLATATPFMPKDDVNRLSSPTSSGGKKRKIAPVSKANSSQSPSKTTKKQPAATSPKTISTVMTGYVPANKDLTWKITVYDIPSTQSQLDTLNHLKAWGQKYVTVTVLIELNQEATRLWNDGAWTALLGGLPGVPASVNTATLYLDNPAHSILAPIGSDLDKQRRRNLQKVNQEGDSKVQTNITNTQLSKKTKVAKKIKNIDKVLGGIDKLTILAEIRSMLRKLEAS
ncbi:hypothetical protein RhiirA5_438501 [Rhizophagus irregularis]|uniref:Uncharacterized protein n=1 Tax=Rhizophagus irregularis TaxID=588596 RepID=A0A2N0NJ06_9GLOM|nr:hypothetical protein RhiirA5_438501 [Rhizophagus irregularis]